MIKELKKYLFDHVCTENKSGINHQSMKARKEIE